MRVLMGLVAVAQAAIVAVWGYQFLADRHRPPDQQWWPRHLPLFICLQGAVTAATFVAGDRLGD
jgi:hypothetical protein